MSDRWKHDNWHTNPQQPEEHCPYCRIRELEAEVERLRQDRRKDMEAMEVFYATLKKYGYENSNDLVDRNIALEQEVERLQFQASKCKWCGFSHERGMNTLCPFTIAERKLAWQPIETAPKDGRTLLLGYRNSHGYWRTLRGQWFTEWQIAEEWDEPDAPEGWYETSVENDEPPNCWGTCPTHWMPLPEPPKESE